MIEGRVKWFSDERGFGFITLIGNAELRDAFVHYSSVEMEGRRTLRAGQAVTLDLESRPQGPIAVNVKPVEA